ncbi:MAG: hydrogenase expression/formation protein HypE [Polyangiales bacterium]
MDERDPLSHPHFAQIERVRRRAGRVKQSHVDLAHGGGGKAMRDLIDDVIAGAFAGCGLERGEDAARIPILPLTAAGDRLAFTTDTYVVTPLFFPGADIGKLAVNGTLNDLATSGAKPLYLSCGLVIEEGLPIATLRRVLDSMADAARAAGVVIATGDTKVVPRGKCDQLFINTAGIGVIPTGRDPRAAGIQPDDVLLVNGSLGDHATAILIARGELKLESEIPSDCAALHGLVDVVCSEVDVHAMRDVTRGGLSAVLNELALASEVGLQIDEAALPVRPEVRGLCEILGLDPVHMANEGKLLLAVPKAAAEHALALLRAHPLGRDAAIIGRARAQLPGVVTLQTGLGGERILDMLVGEPLPRIC